MYDSDFLIYKGCTNPIYLQLLKEDGTPREYYSGETIIFALSPDRKKENVVINQTMTYDANTETYFLALTPEMTENLIGDERYYFDVKCVTENGTFSVQPITPAYIVPDLAEVPDD